MQSHATEESSSAVDVSGHCQPSLAEALSKIEHYGMIIVDNVSNKPTKITVAFKKLNWAVVLHKSIFRDGVIMALEKETFDVKQSAAPDLDDTLHVLEYFIRRGRDKEEIEQLCDVLGSKFIPRN